MRATSTSPTAALTKTDANAGRVAGVFGLRGELKIDPSRIGEDALAEGLDVRATLRDGSLRTVRIASMRRHKGRPLVRFAGVDDATAAEVFVGASLAVGRADVVLQQDEYLDEDLVGCVLVDSGGVALGEVVGIEHYPAQDVMIVAALRQAQGDDVAARDKTAMLHDVAARGKTAMVPLVRAFVKRVDVAAKRIEVELPLGLLDDALADVDR